MDTSKPVGDACRVDGTLKDASEMEWPDSPTEQNRALIEDYNHTLDRIRNKFWLANDSES